MRSTHTGSRVFKPGSSIRRSSSIRTALRLDVANPDYLYLLGAVLFNLGRVRESLNAVERGLAADPEHVDCMNLRGVAQRKLKRWNESRESFAAALAIDPENAASHLAQGALLLSQGEAGAVEHLLEARRLDPIDANDGQAIAAALGRQLPPFRWIAPFVPRWYLWRPKAVWAASVLLMLTCVGLYYAVPPGPDGSPATRIFGAATLNVLLLPYTIQMLAAQAAIALKRRLIGAPWRQVLGQVPRACLPLLGHALATRLGYMPNVVLTVLALVACASFVSGLAHVRQGHRQTSHLYDAYAGLLAISACMTIMFLKESLGGTLTNLAVFALLSFFSDNVARTLRLVET